MGGRMTLRIELTCPKHPTYKAEHKPKAADCYGCSDMWGNLVYVVATPVTLVVNGRKIETSRD